MPVPLLSSSQYVARGAPGGAATPGRVSGQGLGYGPELLDELSRVKVVHWEPAPPA